MFAYKTLKSGTDIRGVASEGGSAPINLTDEVVERIAAGFLVWCEKHLDKCAEGLKIAVGHDSRISADRIAALPLPRRCSWRFWSCRATARCRLRLATTRSSATD